MGPPNDLVLLIHGTFAGRREDEGDNWWQRGSRAWTELRKRLPFGVQLPQRGQLFHWSGENSERARSKAAGDLLSHLLKLEASGQYASSITPKLRQQLAEPSFVAGFERIRKVPLRV
jgi:hypothetical protein